jgi:hypothetical protein
VQPVEALYCCPEDRGSDSDKVIGFLNLHYGFSRTKTLGSTEPLIQISTRNLPEGKGRPASETHNLTVIFAPI